jgi:hypothetical protein
MDYSMHLVDGIGKPLEAFATVVAALTYKGRDYSRRK